MIGSDIAFCLKSKEKYSATGNDYSNVFDSWGETNHPKPSIDIRPRIQVKAQYQRLGIIAGYSLGITNYPKPTYYTPPPAFLGVVFPYKTGKVYSSFLRFGISYRIL